MKQKITKLLSTLAVFCILLSASIQIKEFDTTISTNIYNICNTDTDVIIDIGVTKPRY